MAKETRAEAMAGNTAALKHSMHAVEARGPVALPEALREREFEVIENLATHEGVLRELERVAKHYVLICDCGIHWLDQIIERGANPWITGGDRKPEPALKSLATYLAGAARTLAKLAEARGDQDVLDIASVMAGARDEK